MTQKNLSAKQNRLTDIESFPRGKRSGGGRDWEFRISRCKLLYIEWINNKVLLYSTRKYTQYPVIKHNGKEYENKCMYMVNQITLLYSRN